MYNYFVTHLSVSEAWWGELHFFIYFRTLLLLPVFLNRHRICIVLTPFNFLLYYRYRLEIFRIIPR